MTLITLAPGRTVAMHPPTGFDDLVALSIRAKMEPFLTEFEGLTMNWAYQARFALIVACTDQGEGLPFDLPRPDAEGPALADAYRSWLKLPRKVFRKWYDAVDDLDEAWNAPDLTPEAHAGNVPLANASSSSKSESTTT